MEFIKLCLRQRANTWVAMEKPRINAVYLICPSSVKQCFRYKDLIRIIRRAPWILSPVRLPPMEEIRPKRFDIQLFDHALTSEELFRNYSCPTYLNQPFQGNRTEEQARTGVPKCFPFGYNLHLAFGPSAPPLNAMSSPSPLLVSSSPWQPA